MEYHFSLYHKFIPVKISPEDTPERIKGSNVKSLCKISFNLFIRLGAKLISRLVQISSRVFKQWVFKM